MDAERIDLFTAADVALVLVDLQPERAGMVPRTWLQALLELQRDWTRHATYAGALAILKEHAGNYGIGLTYAAAMAER
jgi:hypothetical protein